MTETRSETAPVAGGEATAPSTGRVAGPPAPSRGRLKAYLGAMPGSGKTFAMLREGRDRRDAGEDVVIGFVETHGRARTQEAIGTLEVLPRITVDYRGTTLSEMDVEAVLARRPQVALIDELAHTNAPGVRHHKRWEDIEDIRDAGIDVITTMNIQHLESVKDVVERITGITVHETVPDAVLDRADEVQFIDITPEALRKRMRHGNVYPLEQGGHGAAQLLPPGQPGRAPRAGSAAGRRARRGGARRRPGPSGGRPGRGLRRAVGGGADPPRRPPGPAPAGVLHRGSRPHHRGRRSDGSDRDGPGLAAARRRAADHGAGTGVATTSPPP